MGLTNTSTTVTFVTSHVSPMFGIAAATVALADSLADDYAVRIVTIDSSDTVSFLHSSIVHRAWGDKENLGWKRIVTLLRTVRNIAELEGDDVIILSGVWAAIPVLLAARRNRLRRTIVWEHSLTDQHVVTSPKTKLLRAIARPLYRRAAATVAVSDLVADDLRQAGFGPPIIVVPNIIRPLPGSRHDAVVIPGRLVTVGALVKVKNQSLALHTLALLPPDYSLDIVGDGPLRAELEHLADRLGVADRVHFCGYVADPDEHYSRAEVVVQPCAAETFGLVLFEAADYRKPVIAPTTGMAGRVVPTLVPGIATTTDAGSFAAAVRILRHSPVPAREFDEAAGRRRNLQDSVIPDWQRLIDAVNYDTRRLRPTQPGRRT